jgi:hypothetical protein
LRTDQQHSIELVERIKANLHLEEKYDCHAFTFDLRPPNFTGCAAPPDGRMSPGGDFVAYLIAEHLVEAAPDDIRDGDIVVYFYEDRSDPLHTGRWNDGRVLSKWGKGHVWLHPLEECPSPYGTRARFFRGLSREETIAAWNAFCAKSEDPESTR